MLLNVFVVYSFYCCVHSLLLYEYSMITHSLLDRHFDNFQYQLL